MSQCVIMTLGVFRFYTRSSKWRTPAWAQITYHGFSLIHFCGLFITLLVGEKIVPRNVMLHSW